MKLKYKGQPTELQAGDSAIVSISIEDSILSLSRNDDPITADVFPTGNIPIPTSNPGSIGVIIALMAASAGLEILRLDSSNGKEVAYEIVRF